MRETAAASYPARGISRDGSKLIPADERDEFDGDDGCVRIVVLENLMAQESGIHVRSVRVLTTDADALAD